MYTSFTGIHHYHWVIIVIVKYITFIGILLLPDISEFFIFKFLFIISKIRLLVYP